MQAPERTGYSQKIRGNCTRAVQARNRRVVMKASQSGSGRPGVQAVPSAWRKNSCGLDFPPSNDIPEGNGGLNPGYPFSFSQRGPKGSRNGAWCPVPWSPGAVADPSSEKVTDAFQAPWIYRNYRFFFNFSRYLQVDPWKGTNHEQPNELINRSHSMEIYT